jgi:ABC-type protease/lipase transport system fused ATPase/permease subunit
MTKDRIYRPTTNDIIKAHDHLEGLTQQTSFITSLIVWAMFTLLFIIIIAFLSYMFHYLYTVLSEIPSPITLNLIPTKSFILLLILIFYLLT